MKTLLSVLAASALALSASSAFAMCGHQSAKLDQSVAGAPASQSEQEAVTTHEPKDAATTTEEDKAE